MPGQYDLVAFGNPLLDMQIRDGEEVLKKYNLKSNDAILAEESHQSIYDHIVEKYDVVYVAGGAAQNTARMAQYVLPPKSTAYLGAVGDDDLATQLRAANDREGLRAAYQINKELPTGSCAAIISGHDRSLVTRLGAAESFNKSHLETQEVKQLIQEAKFFYMGGFFLTHGVESGLIIAKQAKANGVPFSLNLSAPFIPQFFSQQLDSILPLASLVIGNESEAVAYAVAHKWETTDLKVIAEKLAASPSELDGQRTVIITHGSEATIVVEGGKSAREIPTAKIASEDIVDTNGAGDAFAGGVVGGLILGKSIDEAIKIGQKLGGMCIGQVGPCLKFPKEQIV